MIQACPLHSAGSVTEQVVIGRYHRAGNGEHVLKETVVCNHLGADSGSTPSLTSPDTCLNTLLRQKVKSFTTTVGTITGCQLPISSLLEYARTLYLGLAVKDVFKPLN